MVTPSHQAFIGIIITLRIYLLMISSAVKLLFIDIEQQTNKLLLQPSVINYGSISNVNTWCLLGQVIKSLAYISPIMTGSRSMSQCFKNTTYYSSVSYRMQEI